MYYTKFLIIEAAIPFQERDENGLREFLLILLSKTFGYCKENFAFY